jgi:hypothetical protein
MGSADLQFCAGGHAFYLLDTRTCRQRGRPSDTTREDSIVSGSQRLELEEWLLRKENRRKVKFIATPSLFLPRRKEVAASSADSCRRDAWDGFPDSMLWMLHVIEKHELRRIVFLSGCQRRQLCCALPKPVLPGSVSRGERQVRQCGYTDAVDSDREGSLAIMRESMLTRSDLVAGVFIGGMEGIEAEHVIQSE